MKGKAYRGEFNIELLHEELAPEYTVLEVHPSLGEIVRALYVLEEIPDGVFIQVEDSLDFPDDIMAKHDPSQKSQAELRREKLAADESSGLSKLEGLGLTEDELKALGLRDVESLASRGRPE